MVHDASVVLFASACAEVAPSVCSFHLGVQLGTLQPHESFQASERGRPGSGTPIRAAACKPFFLLSGRLRPVLKIGVSSETL